MSIASPLDPQVPGDLRVQAMIRALGSMLDRVRDARQALPHLAALESSLKRNGLASIDNASYAVLGKVSSQLASLPDSSSEESLRSLQVALLSAMARKKPPRPGAHVETLGGSGLVEVSEVSHTDFLAIANGEMPARIDDRTQAMGYGERTAPLTLGERTIRLV